MGGLRPEFYYHRFRAVTRRGGNKFPRLLFIMPTFDKLHKLIYRCFRNLSVTRIKIITFSLLGKLCDNNTNNNS